MKVRTSIKSCLTYALLITAALFTLTSHASNKDIKSVIPGHELQTVGGTLRTTQTEFNDGSWINRVMLGDKVVFENSSYRGLIAIKASYPLGKPAKLMLLSINTDASACPMALRVLEIRGKDEYVLSKEFGNCLPPANPKWFKILKENPSYRNGEWHIALPPPGPEKIDAARWTKFEWYVYRDGNVIKKPPP